MSEYTNGRNLNRGDLSTGYVGDSVTNEVLTGYYHMSRRLKVSERNIRALPRGTTSFILCILARAKIAITSLES
jgi:hypothetical protein